MSNALVGNPVKRDAPLFWEYGVHGSIQPGKPAHVSPSLAMREGDWKLLCDPDGSHPQLYNLAVDVAERSNVAESQAIVVNNMRNKLQGWWQQMNAYYQDVKE